MSSRDIVYTFVNIERFSSIEILLLRFKTSNSHTLLVRFSTIFMGVFENCRKEYLVLSLNVYKCGHLVRQSNV